MLLHDFYTTNSLEHIDDQKYIAHISLNKHHSIFQGHFPGNPITPGVCMLQIVKELAEEITGEKLQMIKSSNVKFMALINPEVNANLKLEIDISKNEASEYKVKNVTLFDSTVALKLVNTYKIK